MELTETEVESMCDDLCAYYTSDCEFSSDEQRDRHIARIEHLRQMALRAAPEHDTPAGQGATAVDIVFDGPPGPEGGRFVEVESPPGKGISFGKWLQREDGYWVLRIANAHGERQELRRKEPGASGMTLALESAPSMAQIVEQARKDGFAQGIERAAKRLAEYAAALRVLKPGLNQAAAFGVEQSIPLVQALMPEPAKEPE